MKTLVDREDLIFSPPQLGCVLYLAGLPGGGGRIYDRSPYGNHGTITGATWERLPSGLWYQAMDGDDRVTITDHASLAVGTGDFTAKVWMRTTDASADQGGLMAKWAGSAGWDLMIENGKVQWFITVGGEAVVADAAAQADGVWHQCIAVRRTTTGYLYIDGVEQTDTLNAGVTDLDAATDLLLGNRGGLATPYTGDLALEKLKIGIGWDAGQCMLSFNREKHLFGVW